MELTFKKPAKGLESIRVLGPGGVVCIGSERWPKRAEQTKTQIKGREMLRQRRARPSRQGRKTATPAQEVPLLPEHPPYGSLVPPEGPASS